MPSKRKRASQNVDKNGDIEPVPVLPKRKRKALHYDPIELCQELYETIRNYKNEDGKLVCETFIRVPKRRTAADYYDVVTTPIDLLKIQQKLKTDEYEELDQLTADVELMVNNAKAYYKKNSQEYKDAENLMDIYVETKNDLFNETFGEPATSVQPSLPTLPLNESVVSVPERRRSTRKNTQEELLEEVEEEEPEKDEEEIPTINDDGDLKDDPEELTLLFKAVMAAKDGDRDLSEAFQRLPPKSKYPKYYEAIREPVDLKMIAQKINEQQYPNLNSLVKDLSLMLKNAKSFYEKKSQVYKDAVMLKKMVTSKRQELLLKKAGIVKSSERLRTRERSSLQKLSAMCASLKYPDDDDESDVASCHDNISQMEYEDESGGETIVPDDESLLWSLYNYIKNYTNSIGQVLAEPFFKLPSKRRYPDYYEEIKKPISLFNIRKKIKGNAYSNLDELAADMSLVFENAKLYNTDESRLYKDASRLQKLFWEKKRELDKCEVKETALMTEEIRPSCEFEYDIVRIERDGWEEESTPRSHQKFRRSGAIGDSEKKKSQRKGAVSEDTVKQRMITLYKTVYDCCDNSGRFLRDIFVELPSKKDYPDYYQVIMEPIDMNTIENKIKNEKYVNEHKLLGDFELMFNNARHYNEEESQVYCDADMLEKVLKTKWKSMIQSVEGGKKSQSKNKSKSRFVSPLCLKLQNLYDTIKDYSDSKGRLLSTPFLKLPLKSEYPDYYEVIKKPIEMQRIQQRLASNQYETVEDMVADFVQMFDNACKYNEPDSLIYKDALTLQRVCLEKKMEMSSDGSNEIPDIQAITQELMMNLFISVYNYQDEEGRCYSDSFAELPERDPDEDPEISKEEEKPLTFDQVKKNLNKGRYKRVDRFQEDMFKVFERARQLSRTDSQLYEDAIEMQMFFIKIRDELCKNGEILLTPALSYTERHLQSALEAEKREKLPKEQKEDEEKKKQPEADGKEGEEPGERGSENSMKFREQMYHVGDFVYIEPREKGLEPHIMCIEKLFIDSSGTQVLHGNWFYRPNETFHLATRKFLEKEVFKSDFFTTIPLNQVLGKCYVMFVKDYFKMMPEGFADKDVYVCESRYNARHKAFKKIKIWQVPVNEQTKILSRDQALSPVRVMSVFADKSKVDVSEEDDGETSILDKHRENVILEGINQEIGCTFFEQYNVSFQSFKLGDSVYVKPGDDSEAVDRPLIVRIDKIWETSEKTAYIFGPLFIFPSAVEHSPTRLFYRREVFLSCKENTFPVSSILSKCCVQHIKDYCSCRLTEILEQNVYVCESKYLQNEKSIRKLAKGLKKYSLSPKVTDDEVYFFKKHIVPPKEPSPLLPKASDESYIEGEDSCTTAMNDLATESLNTSVEETVPPEKPQKKVSGSENTQAEKPHKKVKSSARRQPSGYIVFAGEIRKQIQHENPDCSFGDISRIVGTKWRNLSKEEKEHYEEKAKRIAEEQAAKQQEAEKAFNESLNNPQSPWSDYSRSMSPASGTASMPNEQQQMQGNFQGQYGYQGYPGFHPGLPIQPLQRGPPGVALLPGQRPFMSPYHQHPSMRYPGSQPGMGQSAQSRMTPSPHPTLPGMSPTPHPTPYPGMTSSPHPNVSLSTHSSMVPQPHPASGQMSMPTARMSLVQPQGMSPQSQPPTLMSCSPQGTPDILPPEQGSMVAPPPPPPPRPPSPMFVSVPPKTQRLLHSEAYLRYIEGLNSENKTVSDWNKSLTATRENTPASSEDRLPGQWLSQGASYHGTITNALWALRDLMLKDTLNISQTLPFEALCGRTMTHFQPYMKRQTMYLSLCLETSSLIQQALHYLILEANDRNQDFRGNIVSVTLPPASLSDWPALGFKQLNSAHRIEVPQVYKSYIDGYLKYHHADDAESTNDTKSLEKGQRLLDASRVEACSFMTASLQ